MSVVKASPLDVIPPAGRVDNLISGSDALMSVDAAAKMCGVSEKAIRNWIRRGHLAYTLDGPAKRIRIARANLDRLLHGGSA